jgi:hypothetical protein
MEMADLRSRLDEAVHAREVAEQAELELRAREREVEGREERLELELARRAKAIEADAAKRVADEHEARVRELEAEKDTMRAQIDALRTRSDGSAQERGVIHQEMFVERLAALHPADDMAVVGRGRAGADVHQTVRGASGEPAGRILWESKAAKQWRADWLSKLEADRRDASADVAVLVTTTPPPEGAGLRLLGGLIVADPTTALQVSSLLRTQLLNAAHLVATMRSNANTAGRVFEFIGSAGFVEPVLQIWASFDAEQRAIDAERRVLTTHWQHRQDNKERGVEAVARILGGLHSAGAALPDTVMPALPSGRL